MATLQTIDSSNNSAGEIELYDQILETPYHRKVVSDVVRQFLAGQQQGTHSVKGRSEVSYSTRKLYRQKGTGNARAGSAKSPIRRHGGVVFGPQPRSHAFRLNKKVRRLAVRSVFAEKVRQNGVVVLDQLELADCKTKNFKAMLIQLGLNEKTLIVTDNVSDNLRLASRNLQNVHVLNYRSLNVYEMMRLNKVVFIKDALEAFKERLN